MCDDTGYAIKKNSYDEFGQCIAYNYYGVGGNPIISTKYYCASICYDYDERGNNTYIWYNGLEGENIERKDLGVSACKKEYDEFDHLIWLGYFNTESCMVIHKNLGYARNYEGPNLVEEKYLDANGELMINKDEGYAMMKRKYGENGKQTLESYHDIKKNLFNTESGYAMKRYKYDEEGDWIQTLYFDQEGKELER